MLKLERVFNLILRKSFWKDTLVPIFPIMLLLPIPSISGLRFIQMRALLEVDSTHTLRLYRESSQLHIIHIHQITPKSILTRPFIIFLNQTQAIVARDSMLLLVNWYISHHQIFPVTTTFSCTVYGPSQQRTMAN
ncbi:uncharacterized protein LOC144433039 [Glandiceps talaboti]